MAAAPPQNKLYLIPFNLVFSALMLSGLHGSSCIKILIILTLNYVIAKSCKGSKFGPLLTWVFNGAVLFANDRYNGYRFGDLSSGIQFLVCAPLSSVLSLFNRRRTRTPAFTRDGISASISPCSDLCRSTWTITGHVILKSPLRSVLLALLSKYILNTCVQQVNPRNMSEKERQNFAHPKSMFTYLNFLSYVLYPPLYIAGPIMTFNDYLWQVRALLFFFQHESNLEFSTGGHCTSLAVPHCCTLSGSLLHCSPWSSSFTSCTL